MAVLRGARGAATLRRTAPKHLTQEVHQHASAGLGREEGGRAAAARMGARAMGEAASPLLVGISPRGAFAAAEAGRPYNIRTAQP